MFEFEKKTWYDPLDSRAIPISPSNLNRIEEGVEYSVNGTNSLFGHWWKKSRVVDGAIEFLTPSTKKEFYIWATANDASVPIYYSSSVSANVDKTTGRVYATLINPKEWTPTYNGMGDGSKTTLYHKYFMIGDSSGETLHYCNSDIYRTSTSSGENRYGFYGDRIYTLSLSRIYGEIEYIWAESKNAYLDGWSDTDFALYEYLGIPFENSRESYKTSSTTGYYIGSGESERLIRTERKPKCVFIFKDSYDVFDKDHSVITTETFSLGCYNDNDNDRCVISDNGFTVVDKGSSRDTNRLGYKYDYIVLY